MKLSVIVEGHGETEAVRFLVQRIANEFLGLNLWTLPHTVRVSRGTMLQRPKELASYLQLANQKISKAGTILLLLDADDDCPAKLGPELLAKVCALRPDLRLSVVLANREYEGWFLAASESLGLPFCENPEKIRDAKGWIERARGEEYNPPLHQAGLTTKFDLSVARERADSFDKFCREVQTLLEFHRHDAIE
jgi:Domain of unknown function (DUF4276)